MEQNLTSAGCPRGQVHTYAGDAPTAKGQAVVATPCGRGVLISEPSHLRCYEESI